MSKDILTQKDANHLYFQTAKWELIVHKQSWPEHTSWYIMEKNGDAMIRVSLYRDQPDEAIVSDLFVHEDERGFGLGEYLFKFAVECALNNGIRVTGVAGSDIGKHLFEKYGFLKTSTGNYLHTV